MLTTSRMLLNAVIIFQVKVTLTRYQQPEQIYIHTKAIKRKQKNLQNNGEKKEINSDYNV